MPIRTFICWYNPMAPAPSDEVMARYDLIIGRGCPRERRELLRRTNPNIRFIIYVNAIDFRIPPDAHDVEFIQTGAPLAPEHRYQGLDLQRDIWVNHRDYLLRNRVPLAAGSDPRAVYVWGYQRPYDRTASSANRFFLDPRSGWRDRYAQACEEAVASGSYDGVFCDNAGPTIEWNFKNVPDGLKPDIDDAQWSAAMSAMLSGVARRLKAGRADALVFANTCGGFIHPDADGIAPTPFWLDSRIDGAMDEFFAYARRDGRAESYLPEPLWRQQIRAMLCCERLGRAYVAQANGDELDHAARLYSLASFLIGAGAKSVFNYNPGPAATYKLVYRFPEWDIDMGGPLEQYGGLDQALAAGQGLAYARRFERGLVLVNPSAAQVAVPLDGQMEQVILEGGTIEHGGCAFSRPVPGPLTLPPHSAAILIHRA
ncbi:MAG: putative glycoside hydrolase [Phycisphaerae bacterium]